MTGIKRTPEELEKILTDLHKHRTVYVYDAPDANKYPTRLYYVTGISAGAGVLKGNFYFTYLRVHNVDDEEMTCSATSPYVPFIKEMDEFLEEMVPLRGDYTVRLNF